MVNDIGARPRQTEEQYESWLEEVTERADPFMAWLGVVFALVVGYELTVDMSPRTERVLAWTGWVIWGIFLLEYGLKLWLAPNRGRFVRRHWFQALILAIPTLRVLRFLRLVRLGRALPAARVVSSSYRSVGTARRLFRSRIGYLAATTMVVSVGLAELAFLFERSARQPGFDSFGDALLWSTATVVALQADPVPESAGGRLVMLGGFVFGLVVVASLAGMVGAYLVDERRERAEWEDGASRGHP